MLKAQTLFVKPPFYIDYGLRLRISSLTFINWSCVILNILVINLIISERCTIGPNCCSVSVSYPLHV